MKTPGFSSSSSDENTKEKSLKRVEFRRKGYLQGVAFLCICTCTSNCFPFFPAHVSVPRYSGIKRGLFKAKKKEAQVKGQSAWKVQV
ncbi:uncharacterized protein J3R85_012039 [Psidium guajava]|nr:uncharacterized protein J3R85_012039 [Psidium guajava]